MIFPITFDILPCCLLFPLENHDKRTLACLPLGNHSAHGNTRDIPELHRKVNIVTELITFFFIFNAEKCHVYAKLLSINNIYLKSSVYTLVKNTLYRPLWHSGGNHLPVQGTRVRPILGSFPSTVQLHLWEQL